MKNSQDGVQGGNAAPAPADDAARHGWILYDGQCAFCVAVAQRLEQFFRSRGFVSLPLQTPWVQRQLGLIPGAPLEEMRVLTATGRDYGGVDALLFLARQVWYLRPLAMIGQFPVIRSILATAYRWFATRRGCAGQCQISLTSPKVAPPADDALEHRSPERRGRA